MKLFKKAIKLFVVCLFIKSFLLAQENSIEQNKPKTICLNMIVKNESKVIKRCLSSIKHLLDYWVICDTGSTDGTQDIIKDFLKEIPGELHERPWIDFAHNREEALQLAKGKGDYVMFIDADETLQIPSSFNKDSLTEDAYLCILQETQSRIKRCLFINNKLDWHWQGILHEQLVCKEYTQAGHLDDVIIYATYPDGCRSQDPKKYNKDAEKLEKALEKDPNNSRYMYYLGQSYLNAKDYAKALKAYSKRTTMGGWDQEVFFSLYVCGVLKGYLNYSEDEIIQSYCEAFQYNQKRAEPLYRLAEIYMKQENYALAYIIAKHGIKIPFTNDINQVEDWVYRYGIQTMFFNSCLKVGKMQEAYDFGSKLLDNPYLPEENKKALTLIISQVKLTLLQQQNN